MSAHDNLAGRKAAAKRFTLGNLLADLGRVRAGIMTWRSLIDGYRSSNQALDIQVTRADGSLSEHRRTHV